MNQTKKRLAIIKLAISMTDTETIQLQVLKLGLLKTDAKMREILSQLNEQNYIQAQRLISAYIKMPNEATIVQRTSQKETATAVNTPLENTHKIDTSLPPDQAAMLEIKEPEVPQEKPLTLQEKIQRAKEQAIIDQFELFTQQKEEDNSEKDVTPKEISCNDLLDIAPKPKKMSTENINYDALLKVDAEDVLVDNIALDISNKKKDDFFHEALTVKSDELPREDDFFDVDKKEKEATLEEKQMHSSAIKNHIIDDFPKESETVKDTPSSSTISPEQYSPISYIDQKFKNISNQYPAIKTNKEISSSVDVLLVKISKEGYTEEEIEKAIQKMEYLSQTNKAEAAQLLLVCAATESKYAQFRLARALFKGEILEKNLPEAFTIINRLAVNDDYPEAICDLAQFYENGVGIKKDKKKAELLYSEAMVLGIQRAKEHYERLRKENKGIFSVFRK